jgi:hypothetical protein
VTITGVIARRRVENLTEAIPFYEALTGEQAQRFDFAGVALASVGPFLLFILPEGDKRLARVAATITVDDLPATHDLLIGLGAEVIAPMATTPNGHRLIARHPDGGVFEYVGR